MKPLPLLLLLATALPAQTPAPRLTFDVATIRQSSPTQHAPQSIAAHADSYTATYLPVRLMIAFLYRIPARQILNAPAWLSDDRYDVSAKADKKYPVDDLDTMFQNLLADRFHLRYHLETRQQNVYALTLDHPSPNSPPAPRPPPPRLPATTSPSSSPASAT